MERRQQFCYRALPLSLVFATFEVEAAHTLQIELPAKFCVERVEANDEENLLRAESFSGAELCLIKRPFFL